jgi:hypothetical protein
MNTNLCQHYILAIDLGQAMQPTALAVIEQETEWTRGWSAENRALRLRHLERLSLDVGYGRLIDRIRDLLTTLRPKEQADKSDLIVDITGTGRAVGELMRQRGFDPITVTITGGTEVVQDRKNFTDWRLPKVELIGGLQVAYQTKRLTVAKEMELTPLLTDELQRFKIKPPTLNPNDPESWREGQQDDLVFAVAMGVWRAGQNVPQPRAMTAHWDKKLAEYYKRNAPP